MANKRARQLRTDATDAEQKLWRYLRLLKRQGFHFRRQVPIDHYIVDFACFSARMVIEVDGGQHNMAPGHRDDVVRDDYLRRNNFRVLRFWNNDVIRNIVKARKAIGPFAASQGLPSWQERAAPFHR